MAGYETSANTFTYAIALLACRPDVQKAVQADLDRLLDKRLFRDWSFETDFSQILDGHVGAVMNETLRLYTVLFFLSKITWDTPKPFNFDGRDYLLFSDTLILMNTSATHQNPKHWPVAVPNAKDGPPYPLSSFNPSIWLSEDKGDVVFNPVPSSYVPFSNGPRACMGKRFAQAQFCAVMAAIFRDYSVELAVGGTQAGEKRVRKTLWEEAKGNVERELSDGVGFFMSLKMNGKIPLRLVRRGEEQLLI